jgi:heme oxygenase
VCTFIAFAIRVVQRLSRTLIQLNVATRAHHGIADAPWLELMSPTVDKPRYVAHLLKVYGFEAPLESAFRYTPGLTALIGLRARVRTGLLAQDLMRLGMAASQIAQLPQRFVTFGSAAEALGWMYVVERTALLHGNLRRHLAHRLPETGLATSYLSAYDDQIGMRWSELGCAFDTIAPAPSMVRQIIRAAHQAFVAMHVWFTDAVVSPVKQAMAT